MILNFNSELFDCIKKLEDKDLYLCDSHSHLLHICQTLNTSIPDYLNYCLNNRINKHLVVTVDNEDVNMQIEFMKSDIYNKVIIKSAIGIHPQTIYKNLSSISFLTLEKQYKCVCWDAIGEIGIDSNYVLADFQQQIYLFKKQIELAINYNLPVVIHAIGTIDLVINILSDYSKKGKKLNGIIHAFNGNINQASELNKLGFMIGIGTNILSSNKLKKVIYDIDLRYLLLETDAPYMCQIDLNNIHPLVSVVNKISLIKYNIELIDIVRILNNNYINLFN